MNSINSNAFQSLHHQTPSKWMELIEMFEWEWEWMAGGRYEDDDLMPVTILC